MHKQGDEIHVNEVEATGARGNGHVRVILIIGTLLAIGALSLIWMTGAFTSQGVQPEAEATIGVPTAAEAEATDAILNEPTTDLIIEDADDIQAVEPVG
jgi:hypothetical protein